MIYELVMEDVLDEFAYYGSPCKEIFVSPSWFQQPAICRTCRQLRNETLKLFLDFYANNIIEDLKFGPHVGHWIWTQGPYMMLHGVSWSNFKEWLQLYYGDERVAKVSDKEGVEASITERVCRPAFDIVRKLADAGVGWDVVEGVLENFKEVTMAGIEMHDFWEP